MKIELKNIDLSNVTVEEQIKKLAEETMEFNYATKEYIKDNTEDNKKHLIEEWWDSIQAEMGYLNIVHGITADELMDYYNKYHLEKLKNRPR